MGKPVEVENCRAGGFDLDSFSRMSPDMVKSIPDTFIFGSKISKTVFRNF